MAMQCRAYDMCPQVSQTYTFPSFTLPAPFVGQVWFAYASSEMSLRYFR